WLRYGMAALTVTLACLLALLVTPVVGELPIEIFFTAVLLSLSFGRLGPGLFALALAILLLDFFFLPPLHSIDLRPGYLVRVVVCSLRAQLAYFLVRARDRLALDLQTASEEMASAADVQHQLFPASRVVPGFDLGGAWCSARATGGDYFDFFTL